MSSAMLVGGIALGSAFSFSVSTALKHRSAQLVPEVETLSSRSVASFLLDSLRQRLWLAGAVFDLAGLALQVTALHLGELAIVQPLLLTGLVFALALRGGRAISRLEVGWALTICGCLGALLLMSAPRTAVVPSQAADRLPALISVVAGVLVGGGLIAFGRAKRKTAYGPALIGAAVGAVYAATAALLKGLSDILARDPAAVLTSWQLYAVVVGGVLGLGLTQLAFQAAPLSATLPAIAVVDPLLSVVIGVVIFDEGLRTGPGDGVGLLILLLLLIIAVIRLINAGATAHREPPTPADDDPGAVLATPRSSGH